MYSKYILVMEQNQIFRTLLPSLKMFFKLKYKTLAFCLFRRQHCFEWGFLMVKENKL